MPVPRVAIFLPSLRGGGAERVSVSLANQFLARGYEVDLLVSQGGGAYDAHVDTRVRVIDFNQPRVARSFMSLVRYLRKERPATLLSVMTHCNAIALTAKIFAMSPTDVVVSEHNSTQIRKPRAISSFVKRHLYRHAHSVVAVSSGIRDELIAESKLPADHVVTIYNPLDVQSIVRLSLDPISHPWVTDGVPFVVGVGSLTLQKDFATLIRAVHLVCAERPLRLAILGEGPLLADLKRLVTELNLEENVAFLGFQSNPFAWMKSSTIFALSSRWEGLPGVLLEALVCCAQIVSTDCPTGPNEILESGRWGKLVPVGDPEAMARALISAMDDTPPIDSRSRADEFGLSVSVDRYEQLFKAGPRSLRESPL